MAFMTLQAEEWFVLLQKIVGYSAVRIMAGGTVFFDWGVFEDERSLVTAVTLQTEVPGQFVCLQFSMWIVAVSAGHLPFLDRMV